MSVLLGEKVPSAPVSASLVGTTDNVPMVASSGTSAAMAGVAALLQSKVTLVVPAVTPAISAPTSSPVPAVTVALHCALLVALDVAAEAPEAEISVKPPTNSTDVAPSATSEVSVERTVR